MTTTGRKPYFATNYQDMMRHIYMKPKGHSEGRKPYMENDYFDTEYPQLKKYGGGSGLPTGGEPLPDTPPLTECQKWFEKTIIVSAKEYFQNPKFIDKIYAGLGECEKLHLIITSCLQYNSLSFCICCAEAAYIRGGGFTTQSDCAEDFGPVADGEWKCCSEPCPHFEIEVEEETLSAICYKAVTSNCETMVSWERKDTGSGPWIPMDGNCANKPHCKVRATDLCGNASDRMVTPFASATVTGSSTTVKSSSQQYTYTPCNCAVGDPTWSVAGTGATISQTGLLTTDATACGTLVVSASAGGCLTAQKGVRVTDGGVWTNVYNCTPDWNTMGCYTCGAGTNCTLDTIVEFLDASGNVIEMRHHNTTQSKMVNIGGCWCASHSQTSMDVCYAGYINAGGLTCTITEPTCPNGAYCGLFRNGYIEKWSCP